MGNAWPASLKTGSIWLYSNETRFYLIRVHNKLDDQWNEIQSELVVSVPFNTLAESRFIMNVVDGVLISFTWYKEDYTFQEMNQVMMSRDEFVRLFSL